ncbi:MAG: hypothetical protein V3R35_09890 [Woeseiaceae bacterium]
MKLPLTLSCSILLALTACSAEQSEEQVFQSDRPDYYVVDENLVRIKSDFNAMQDKIRLVFIVGPSCGICLRGMDDLNESIVKSIQNDPRIHTLVVHVPTLGAEEKHVIDSIPLLAGPRVTHYWDPNGHTGLEFQETLDIPMYAWDVWFVYEPGSRWEAGEPPPHPDYWEHQLPSLPRDKKLDAERFAAEVNARLAKLPPASEEAKVAALQQRDAGIMRVAQPRSVMIRQNHASRGGYRTLKRIESIRYEGRTEAGGRSYPLTLRTHRPYQYERSVGDGDADSQSLLSWDGAVLNREGPQLDLPASFQDEVLISYEFDGWMTDWKDKGHQIWRLGMKKVGARLPWIMEAELSNGRTWHIYVDSHTGDAFRTALIDAEGNEKLRVEYSDYKEADGFRLPHQIQYFEENRLLATDRFSSVHVTMSSSISEEDTT